MRIILDNETHWKDTDLRQFIRACGKLELPGWTWSGYKWSELRVRVAYTRRRGTSDSSGYAYLHSNHMTIRLSPEDPDKVDLAFVICHEMGHLKGYTHKDMRGDSRYNRTGRYRERYSWAANFPLRKKEKKKRARGVERIEQKLEAIDALIAKWDTKKKRAENALKKYKKKRAYYERRRAAEGVSDES